MTQPSRIGVVDEIGEFKIVKAAGPNNEEWFDVEPKIREIAYSSIRHARQGIAMHINRKTRRESLA